MSPISLARAMRQRGWRYARHSKGKMQFGMLFPNGFGVTQIVPTKILPDLNATADDLATYFTAHAAMTACNDPFAKPALVS